MKTYVVIGMGRFGTAVASELCNLGNEVLAIDDSAERIQQVADLVTHAVVGDARDPAVLKALGVRNYDCAIVSVGNDIGTSALITLALKEMQVPKVVCKAGSHIHRKVLEKIGADRVVFPEHEMGVKLAQSLSHSNVLNFIELNEHYGIVETRAPEAWMGKTIRELDVRAKYKVNIIAVRGEENKDYNIAPGGDYTVKQGDSLVILGESQYTDVIHGL